MQILWLNLVTNGIQDVALAQRLLRTEPVNWKVWLALAGLALTLALFMELHKLWWKRRHATAGRS